MLNIGCGGSLPSHKFIWLGKVRVDIKKAKNVTVVADAHYLPFKTETFSKIIAFEVCEHLVSPSQALAEMRRVLKLHGKIVISIPNVWRIWRIITWLRKKMNLLKKSGFALHRQAWDVYELHNLVSQLDLKISNVWWKDRDRQPVKKRVFEYFLPPEISKSHIFVEIIKA